MCGLHWSSRYSRLEIQRSAFEKCSILTMLTDSKDIIRGIEAGSDYYLTKPFDQDFLISRIEFVLSQRWPADADISPKMEITYSGETKSISPDRKQVLNLLLATYENAVRQNTELQKTKRALHELNDHLEEKVSQRTVELVKEINERKRAEEALRESESRFRGAFEQAAVGMAHVSREGRFLRVNQKLCDITGYCSDELLNLSFRNITHPDDLRLSLDQHRRLLTGDSQTFELEQRYVTKNGSNVWCKLTASLARKFNDGNDYFIVVVEDITKKRSLEAQYLQAQKMEAIGQLAGGVAHDFNNVLTVVLGHAAMMKERPTLSDRDRESLCQISQAAERAANLTRQLLGFSRRTIMQPRQVDLNKVVRDLAKMLPVMLPESINVRLSLHNESLFTFADAGMLDQVLMNLSVNAKDAMPTGGELFIETAEMTVDEGKRQLNPDAAPGRYVWLSVADTGCGIPKEIMDQIFEPFFTTKEPGKGTGLELSTVFGIVKQHHGWIEVDSQPKPRDEIPNLSSSERLDMRKSS